MHTCDGLAEDSLDDEGQDDAEEPPEREVREHAEPEVGPVNNTARGRTSLFTSLSCAQLDGMRMEDKQSVDQCHSHTHLWLKPCCGPQSCMSSPSPVLGQRASGLGGAGGRAGEEHAKGLHDREADDREAPDHVHHHPAERGRRRGKGKEARGAHGEDSQRRRAVR